MADTLPVGPIGRFRTPIMTVLSIELEPTQFAMKVTVCAGATNYSRAEIFTSYFLRHVPIKRILNYISDGDYINWRT